AQRTSADLESLYRRALFLLDEGRLEAAGRVALACIVEQPFDPRAFLLSATVNENLGRYALAERMLRRVLVIDPDSAEAQLRLELLLSRSRRP
ncbi:MAG: tetratricopeptide repeat protein, partial [Polyangiaceae bacterium]|nr:tetratricopeptide repeat protein [Polyangiaceae bacterium]